MGTKENFNRNLVKGRENLIQNVKLVLYKKDPQIFDKIDFENDQIYLNPLLFAVLTSKKINDFNQAIWHFCQETKIEINIDESGYIYISNLGFFHLEEKVGKVSFIKNNNFEIIFEGKLVKYKFEASKLILSKFELLYHPVFLLNEHFFDEFGTNVPVEITNTSKKFEPYLITALNHIKNVNPEWYKLLEENLKKIILFEDKSGRRNSFATQSVHGCIFLNCFQDNYNEVFFIEDIAHQAGHVIFNTFLASNPNIYKCDKNHEIFLNREIDEYNEPRELYVMIHAMYTYESILQCFVKCLDNNIFSGSKRHELLGRIKYTLYKFLRDFELLSINDEQGKNIFFTDEGLEILNWFKETFILVCNKYGDELDLVDISNQPYNFSYSKFLELNPLFENEII